MWTVLYLFITVRFECVSLISFSITEVFRVQLHDPALRLSTGVGALQLRVQHRLLPPHPSALQPEQLVHASVLSQQYHQDLCISRRWVLLHACQVGHSRVFFFLPIKKIFIGREIR